MTKRSIPFKKLITEFNETGNCVVDVDLVKKAWTDKYSISRHHDNYKLVRHYRGESHSKVQISAEQAEAIIKSVGLLEIQSSLFRFGKTYRTESNIISELSRIRNIVTEKRQEMSVLNSVISEFTEALASKYLTI